MYFKKIIKIIFIFLLTINLSSLNASEKIVYVDMNKIMSTSLVAQSLKKKLNKYNETSLNKFKKTLESLRAEENKLIAQKNVIDENEFKEKAKKIQNSFNEYKKNIDQYNNDLKKKQIDANAQILKNLTPILSEFSKNNATSLIIDKKNVIIGKTNLDITDEIIKKLNEKIKDVNL
jgi:Skp family chaperone for outer membrane proteins